MRKIWIVAIIGMVLPAMVAAKAKTDTTASVSGKVHIGTHIEASRTREDMNLSYETNDKRLGSNSGNQYTSLANYQNTDAQVDYGANILVKMKKQHLLGIRLDGKHDWKQSLGTRTETLTDRNGTGISRVGGAYNHPQDQMSDILAGVNYTYLLPRTGDSIKLGYRYHWDYTCLDMEQQVSDRSGWSLYTTNALHQQVSKQTHRAEMDYICRIANGQILDIGITYDRRQINGHTLQNWDQQCRLNADYMHLIQYGGIHARYQLATGPIKLQLGIELRGTEIQQRWLFDYVPQAMLRWQIDSIHSLTGGYRMLIIRPEYCHLDTNKIEDAYTRRYGNNMLIGTHVHHTHLNYQMTLPQITFSTELRYITTNDGLNALWIEKDNVRSYTWGNAGVRHAVSLTPSVNSGLGKTTRLLVAATVLWDERIAWAIQMKNANWGISTRVRLEQQLPYAMVIAAYGDYAYHNTLDLYSYSGHGGKVGIDWRIALLQPHNLHIKLGYTCRFIPDIYITQGAYTGLLSYHTSSTHLVQLQLIYSF